MKRFFLTVIFLLIIAAGAAAYLYRDELFVRSPAVSSTRFDTNADGAIELVRWSVGDFAVLWSWDRDADGSAELLAYDAEVGADGTIRPTGEITAWDWEADSVLDEGEVPPAVQELLRDEAVAASLAAEPTGELSLVGPDIRTLSERFASGYDEWRLSGFRMPIVGASLPALDTLLPGAPRAYRNGVHQGFDMVNGHIGVPTGYSAPVVAAKDGVVVRADHDYSDPTPAEYQQLIATSQAAGATPPDVLDRLRGRQIWIDHGSGIVTRYCHLSGVASGVAEGERVEAGDIVGFVGNSGMEAAVRGSRADAHLHFELRIDGRYLGEGMRPSEIRQHAGRIFGLEPPTTDR